MQKMKEMYEKMMQEKLKESAKEAEEDKVDRPQKK